MPRGDGTGPNGMGQSEGRGFGRSQRPSRGRMGGPFAAGSGGGCVCPKCKTKLKHVLGEPCSALSCPKCGSQMTRG